MGPDMAVQLARNVLIEAMILSAPGCGLSDKRVVESGADADQRAGTDVDDCSETSGRLCHRHRDHALVGAKAGDLHDCIVVRLSSLSGLGV